MQIINLKNNTRPFVIHVQLSRNGAWQDVTFNKLGGAVLTAWSGKTVPKKISDEGSKLISILTCNNTSGKGLLEESLDSLGFPYTVLGKDIPEKDWKNFYKIRLFYEALLKVKTPYVAGFDSRDVIVLDDPAKMIGVLDRKKCDMLFCASAFYYPNCGCDPSGRPYITEEWKEFEERSTHGLWRYLNSGLWFGRTKFCAEFFRACHDSDIRTIMDGNQLPYQEESKIYDQVTKKYHLRDITGDDQVVAHWLFSNYYPRLQLDSDCIIFQLTRRVPLRGYLTIDPFPWKVKLILWWNMLQEWTYINKIKRCLRKLCNIP